jgi:hypothetical protein
VTLAAMSAFVVRYHSRSNKPDSSNNVKSTVLWLLATPGINSPTNLLILDKIISQFLLTRIIVEQPACSPLYMRATNDACNL